MIEMDESKKIVKQFAKDLRLHESDVETIVNRFFYLKQKLGPHGLQGFPEINILLTSIYCYIREPSHGRKFLNPRKFAYLCNGFDFPFSVKDVWRYGKLYFEQELYSRAPVSNVFVYFEHAWYDISKDLSLGESEKSQIAPLLAEIQNLKGHRWAPWIVMAAVIYLLDERRGHYRYQTDLADYFGISEVSLRNAAKAIKHLLKGSSVGNQSQLIEFMEE